LKQTKDVKITYLDSVGTVDIVMRQINMMKQENSRIVLADGSSIGMKVDMNYRDLSGIIGKSLQGIIQMRTLLKEKNAERGEPDAPLLPHEVEDLDSKLKEIIEARDERKKKKKTAVMKEKDSSSGSDNSDDDEEDDDDDDDVKVAASCSSNNPSLNGDNESSDDDSDDDDDNLLYGKSMFSSTSRKSNVKEERVDVLGSKSKDDKEEIIELSSDEEDSDDDDEAESGVLTKKETSRSHTQSKQQERGGFSTTTSGSTQDQTSNERHIHELTEEEQLQGAIKASMEEVEVNEDKENSGGPSRRDSGDGEEFFFDAAETLDEINKNDDNVMQKEEESKPPAVETSSAGNVARIQIKLPNGKRIVKCFDENQLIKDVYSFVANSEEIKGKAFELKVGFPPKNLGGRDESIKSASLDGESISVVWK